MSDIILKQVAGMLKPRLRPGIEHAQEALKKYLDSIELNENETHSTALIDFDNDNAVIVVCTFSGRTFSRAIKTLSKDEIIELVTKLF